MPYIFLVSLGIAHVLAENLYKAGGKRSGAAPLDQDEMALNEPEPRNSWSQVLRPFEVMDTLDEGAFDDLVNLAANVFDTPVAVISFVEGNRRWFKASKGAGVRETTLETSLCQYVLEHDGIFVVENACDDPRFVSNPYVHSQPFLRFYAAVRLEDPEGSPFGSLCVMDFKERTFEPRQREVLKGLGDQVTAQLELQRTIKQLREEKACQEKLFKIAGVHPWVLDIKNDRVTAKQELFDAFGLGEQPDSGVPSKLFLDTVHPDNDVLITEANEAWFKPGRTTDTQFRIAKDDGVRWFSSRSLTDRNDEGTPQRLLGLTVDITNFRKADFERGAIQVRLEEVLEGMPGLVSYWDADLTLRFTNQHFATWCGRDRADLLGKSLAEVTPTAIFNKIRRHIDQVMVGLPQSFEQILKGGNGEPSCLQFDLVPDFKGGTVVGFYSLGTDRTDRWKNFAEQEKNRAHLQRVLDSIPASIAYWDINFINRFANTTYLKWFNKRRIDVEGKHGREVIGDALFDKNFKRIKAAMEGRAQSFETGFVAFDGRKREAIFKYIPDFEDGKVIGFFAMVFDITDRRHAEADLYKSQNQLRTVIDNMPALIGYWTADLRNEFANQAYFRAFGLPPEAIHRMSLEEVVGPHTFEQNQPYYTAVLSGCAQTFDRTTVGPDGKTTHLQATLIPDLDEGRVKGFYSLEADITGRREAELSLLEEKERGRVTLNSIADAVLTTDCEGLVTYMNPRAESMTGWDLSEAKGKPIDEVLQLFHRLRRKTIFGDDQSIQFNSSLGSVDSDYRLRNRNGNEYEVEDSVSPILDAVGCTIGRVVVLHDVSEAKAMASKMAYLAQHDSLTGLPNRVLLNERLQETILRAAASEEEFALVFLDLDYFKNINDSMGHALGDELLRTISDRLIAVTNPCDTVSRQGGDEFILLLTSIESAKHAGLVVDQIIKSIAAPYHLHTIEGRQYKLSTTVSAGIAIYPADGAAPDELMRKADVAMYLAKQAGRNRSQFFSPEFDQEVIMRHSWLQNIREAIDGGHFSVVYQPKISTKDRTIVGVEALVRWQKANEEVVMPGDFIPIAEESGMIVEIGAQVMIEACLQCVQWEEMGLSPIPVSVNVSALQLGSAGFVEFVAGVIRDTRIQPERLELEITESSIMADVDKAAVVLHQLRDLGVKISLDDFGTGYSSLSYLRRFPLDCLKIDRSFVSDLTTNASTAAIMKTICNLGRTLNLQIIAEGVETEPQALLLSSLQCDAMQGYLFSRPVKGEIIARMLPDKVSPIRLAA